jgi:hypothetical protein
MRLSPHFLLAEFLRVPPSEVPTGAVENLGKLCVALLEPLREAMGFPVVIHSGYRAPSANESVGGVRGSDHTVGRAADFHIGHDDWEKHTFEAFHWLRTHKLADIGQLILEDHRLSLRNNAKLWVHVSIVSPKHPGEGDPNQLLASYTPGSYNTFKEEMGRFS